jgi:hypothetical protein
VPRASNTRSRAPLQRQAVRPPRPHPASQLPEGPALAQQRLTELQHLSGNQAVVGLLAQRRVVQRDDADASTKPQDPWDRVASDVFGKTDYADYVASSLTSTTFLGQTLSQVHQDLKDKLAVAEADLKKSQGASYTAPPVGSSFRNKAGMHGWGMAVDFGVLTNPYVLNESNEQDLDKQLVPAYDHIAQFILGKAQSDLRKLKSGRSAFGSGTIEDVYDALKVESDAMRRYFALKDDDAGLTQFLQKEWPALHPGQTAPDLAAIKAQMKEDYEVLGGKTDAGTKRPTGSKADRPFAPTSTGGKGDPATGFLNMGKEFVKALTDAGLAWGAIDIAGEPGDIMHFDTRLGGTGLKAYTLYWKYKTQK